MFLLEESEKESDCCPLSCPPRTMQRREQAEASAGLEFTPTLKRAVRRSANRSPAPQSNQSNCRLNGPYRREAAAKGERGRGTASFKETGWLENARNNFSRWKMNAMNLSAAGNLMRK